jgi:cysteinyl-tRNA synthetase
MTLHLHNSMTRRREAFVPLDPQHVRMYVCGPTVYGMAHVGNGRAMAVYDVLARVLRHLYPRVTYVRNITDVDDKINERAAREGVPISEVTARTGAQFSADMASLGNLPPDVEPRATAHIPEMIEMIGRLVASGHAYAAAGHVLFSVGSFASYGVLSGRDPEELLAGARVEVAPYKRDAGDFVLWKPSPPDAPGDVQGHAPGWDSPWGLGRPGWHIECSAMAWRYLGETFDIHGGGGDLLFPHHENERAQSLCALPGSGFARYWLHNGMLLMEGEKMSKSLGNFSTIRDAVAAHPAEAVRLMLLRAGYRGTLEYSEAGLQEARGELDRFYRALERVPGEAGEVPGSVLEALCDDLNTPMALAALHGLADRAMAGDVEAGAEMRAGGMLLGLLQAEPAAWFRGGDAGMAAEVEAAMAARIAARKAREFARADAIRAEWLARGVAFEDRPDGTSVWRRV